MFGRYRLVELLGRGGMGEVWRAVDTGHDDRVVALKLLGTWLGGGPDFERRFRREAALVARLGSPHVVPIHGYGEIEGRLYLDMQFVAGTDLATLLDRDRERALPVSRAVGIVVQAAWGLAAAHGARLVHRDVKPSNILVTTVGGADHVYVIDFGIARSMDGTATSSAVLGTPTYMAPERFEGTEDHRADVYALGAVLFEALTGRPPFPSTNPLVLLNNHQNTPPPRPSQLRPGLPPELDEVVVRAMAKQPDERYSAVDAFATAVREAVGSSAADITPPPEVVHVDRAADTRAVDPPPADPPAAVVDVDRSADTRTAPPPPGARSGPVWSRRAAVVAGAVLAVVVLVVAVVLMPWNRDTPVDDDAGAGPTVGPTTAGAPPQAPVSGVVAGGGSATQGAAMQAWVAGFVDANPAATVSYDPIGSSAGRDQFAAGGFAFAGSDAPLEGEDLQLAQQRCGGPDAVIELPVHISTLALVYNLDGVDNLRLSPAVIAGIFNRTILAWDDPAIAVDNPDVVLPAVPITPINRSDLSGATQGFTEYLAAAAGPALWPYAPDDAWPVAGGDAVQGTSGVLGAVGAGQGTIGYADAALAGDVSVARIEVGEFFVAPTAEAAAAAVAASPRLEGRGRYDDAVRLDRATTAVGAYPIVLLSYQIACTTYPDAATADLVKAFLGHLISEDGQAAAAEAAGTAPLTAELRARYEPAVAAITSAG